jgi:hypothetical protein
LKAHLAAFPALLATAVGCREELGPVAFPITRVVGLVQDGGRPIRGGWIEFVPLNETVGRLRSAPIGRDGRFDATGVAVGLNLIGLVNLPGGDRMFRSQGSTIRRRIPPGPMTSLTIDLAEERILRQEQLGSDAPEIAR